MITKLSVNDRHSTSICPSNVTRDILERREKQFVSKEVLTKRRYVLIQRDKGFSGYEVLDSEDKMISLGR
jgi:hypothetical protein